MTSPRPSSAPREAEGRAGAGGSLGPPPDGRAERSEAVRLRYHWIRLRASCHPTEDLAKVEAAVRFVAGPDADRFPLQVTALESHHGGTVQLVEATLDRSRAVRDLLQRLFDLPGVRDDLKATLESRTDDDGVFFARVDKQDAYAGRLTLTRGEDCIQLRLKLEHYPATRAAAIASFRRVLESAKP